MTDYLLRLFVLVPLIGGMAWGMLWLWKRLQTGLPRRQETDRPARIVDILAMGTSGRLVVIAFRGQTLLVAASRQGISLVASSDGDFADA